MAEIWKVLKKFPHVQVSNLGNLRHTSSKNSLETYISNSGYECITLYSKSQHRSFTRPIHSLVAEAFLGDRPNGMTVNHKDSNKLNNQRTNLEYITQRQNVLHAVRNGAVPGRRKLTKAQIKDVLETYEHYKGKAKNSILYRAMAEQLTVTPQTIWAIVQRRSWKYTKS